MLLGHLVEGVDARLQGRPGVCGLRQSRLSGLGVGGGGGGCGGGEGGGVRV